MLLNLTDIVNSTNISIDIKIIKYYFLKIML